MQKSLACCYSYYYYITNMHRCHISTILLLFVFIHCSSIECKFMCLWISCCFSILSVFLTQLNCDDEQMMMKKMECGRESKNVRVCLESTHLHSMKSIAVKDDASKFQHHSLSKYTPRYYAYLCKYYVYKFWEKGFSTWV